MAPQHHWIYSVKPTVWPVLSDSHTNGASEPIIFSKQNFVFVFYEKQ